MFFSAQAVTAACAHILARHGLLSLDEPISGLWPAFATDACLEAPKLADSGNEADDDDDDDGRVDGDAKYLPDVAVRLGWKRVLTLRHVLAHTSGLEDSCGLPGGNGPPRAFADWAQVRGCVEKALPTSSPGETCAYVQRG